MAVSMNFLSAVLVLILGIGIIYQLATLLTHKKPTEEEKKALPKTEEGIIIGRSTLLLRITSGMGAFLVIVDNKTDLGVMALSSLAILSGIIFLGILQQEKIQKKEILKYLILSGVFFAFACLGKPTAFVDIALFGIFLVGLRFSAISSLGIGMILAGVLRYLGILSSTDMLSLTQAKYFIIL